MDRRVIFVAEPAPLISHSRGVGGEEEYYAGDSSTSNSSSSNSRGSRSSRKKFRLDLGHLRGVTDDLSAFCRVQQQQQQGCGYAGNDVIPEIAAAAANQRPWSLLPRVRNQQDTALLPAASVSTPGRVDHSSSSSDAGGDGSKRSVLLAAVFPCPAFFLPEETERESQSRRLTLASALADALESCGVWLSPEDFEARVLAPTRALIDLQLEDLEVDEHDEERLGNSDPAAGAAARRCSSGDSNGDQVCSAGSGGAASSFSSSPSSPSLSSSSAQQSSGGGGGVTGAEERPRSPSPSCGYGGTAAAAVEAAAEAAAELFVRSAADEITLLTREAAAEMEVIGPGPGGGAGRRPGGMFDVLWVAASSTLAGGEQRDVGPTTAVCCCSVALTSVFQENLPPQTLALLYTYEFSYSPTSTAVLLYSH